VWFDEHYRELGCESVTVGTCARDTGCALDRTPKSVACQLQRFSGGSKINHGLNNEQKGEERRMANKLTLASTFVLISVVGGFAPAAAHMQGPIHGSNPCFTDSKQYCGGYVNTSSGIPTCLSSHMTQLSDACKARLQRTMGKKK
jgi:hypothetical protein